MDIADAVLHGRREELVDLDVPHGHLGEGVGVGRARLGFLLRGGAVVDRLQLERLWSGGCRGGLRLGRAGRLEHEDLRPLDIDGAPLIPADHRQIDELLRIGPRRQDRGGDPGHLLGREGWGFERDELVFDPHHRLTAAGDAQLGGTVVGRHFQQFVDVGGEGGGGCRAHREDTWCGWEKRGPKNRRESRSPPLPDRCRPPIGRRFCRMGTPARSSFPGRPKRKPHPPGNRLEENPPLTTVAAHVGASHAAAGGVPDIPPTKLEALCARSAKKSCRRHFSSDFLPPAPAAVPAGAGWRGGRERLPAWRRPGATSVEVSPIATSLPKSPPEGHQLALALGPRPRRPRKKA